jgi:hypothetical protein
MVKHFLHIDNFFIMDCMEVFALINCQDIGSAVTLLGHECSLILKIQHVGVKSYLSFAPLY